MKYSYNWLKELSGTTKNPQELAQLLMLHAFEVEGIEQRQNKLEGVVVGEILEITKHPNADKLQVTKTDIGTDVLTIVCGAKNIAVGDKVPVAVVGTTLPASAKDGTGDFVIKEAEIRGEKSFGMLCAEDELGLGASHEGILQLDKELAVGSTIADVLELSDATIEIDILANRAHDALSHVGMAREIAALEGREIDYDYDGLKLPRKNSKKLTVAIQDKNICSRYIGIVMENVKVSQSPQWIKNRLKNSGIRPINNIVDATNLVMLEIGQPLHAFDLDKVSNQPASCRRADVSASRGGSVVNIAVRTANEGEEIVILDGTVKKLSNQDIVIVNEEKAIALAGVMGGLESGVTEETTSIILEAANFSPAMIRRTRMRLGLASDAAMRFEKEIDPNIAEKAAMRVVEILEHIADATLEGVDEKYLAKQEPWNVQLDLAKADKLLGVTIDKKISKKILATLGVKVSGSGNIIKATIPTFRLDLQSAEDLIEEIGRVYGYEKITPIAPLVSVAPAQINEKRLFARNMKDILASLGFFEMYNYSFYSQKDVELAKLSGSKHLELEAPMNPEQALMRVSLIPGVLKNVRENLKNFKEFNVFEIGKIYLPSEDILPQEKNMLVGAIIIEKKNAKEEKMDLRHSSNFFHGKSIMDHVLERLGITDQYYDDYKHESENSPSTLWHKGRSAQIKTEGKSETIGYIGEISPLVLEGYDISTRVVVFELEMDKLAEISESEREFTPIRKHPTLTRDISLIAGADVRIDDILMIVQRAGGDLVLDVDLFDAIDFSDNTSSFAFHLIFGAAERSLTGKEVDEIMQTIAGELEEKLDLKMRR